MPRIHFVRHAQSENNLSSARIRGESWDNPARMQSEVERARKPDPTLSEVGFEQCTHLAARLEDLARSPRTLLISSPTRRALLTTLPLARAAQLERFECRGDLYEVGGCYYCGRAVASATAAQLEAEFPVRCESLPAQGWFAGHVQTEGDDEARARVDRAIAWIETLLAGGAYDDLILVVHGDLMSRWLRRWLGVPWARDLAFVHGNTGITQLAWDARRGLQLRALNDESHLPVELRTGDDTEAWWRYALPDLELRRYQGWGALPGVLADEVGALRATQLLAPEGKTLAGCVESDARSLHVVAWAQGALAGYVQYDPELERLRQLVVAPASRGAGLGRRLVSAVEDEVRRQARGQLRVHAWIESRDFFGFMGFEAPGEVVGGADGERAWIAMVKGVV